MEVSLAIEQLLIAPEGTAWTPARVDNDSPPTGFVNLGCVVEDTPSLVISREKFELDTGIPRIRQYEVVTGMNGTFNLTLHSDSWRKLQWALGNYSAVASPTQTVSISSVTNRNTISLATTSGSLPVGRQIIIASSAALAERTDAIETQIASVAANALDLYLTPTPIRTPTAGMYVYYYNIVSQAFGTSKNSRYALLGVADLLDGSQIIHEFRKVSPAGELNIQITPEQNVRVPMSFNAFGFAVTDARFGNISELVVALNHYIPRGA